MSKLEQKMFNIINRHHAAVSAVNKIESDLQYVCFAKNLNTISARRRKKGKK